MQEHRRILRKAGSLPAGGLTEWEQGFIAGGEPAYKFGEVINRIRAKVEAWEAKYGPLSILDD